MNASPPPDTVTVFVRLLDEGTDVWRPARGRLVSGDHYELLPDQPYDPSLETWEFVPGTTVVCERRTLSGGMGLVAVQAFLHPRDID